MNLFTILKRSSLRFPEGRSQCAESHSRTMTAAMLRRLSGRAHRVVTVVWLVSAAREAEATSVSEVTFGELDDATLDAYIEGGEWKGKAGAYAIQGSAQAFIAHLSGSHSGVMGLPLYETARLLDASDRAEGPGGHA